MHGVGVLSPVGPQRDASINPAVLAENLGYESIWVSQNLGNGGHVILPIGGQKSPHWRTRDLPKGGQQNSRS